MTELYEQASEFVLRRIGRESILVPIHNKVGDLDSVYTLNEVASLIWSMIDGRTATSSILDRLCDEYDVPREDAANDLGELLGTLTEARLIRPVA